MAAKRPDFDQIKKLISQLETLESDFAGIFGEEQAQREALQGICRQVTRAQAVNALAFIPVGELKNSRAGIRTAALEQAGFHNLLDLYRAPDYALQAVDGVGEKQVDSIRVILDEFLNRLAERERIRLTLEIPGGEGSGRQASAAGESSGRQASAAGESSGRQAYAAGEGSGRQTSAAGEGAGRPAPAAGESAQPVRELIRRLSIYRHADLVRRDAQAIRDQVPDEIRRVTEAVEIRSRLGWFFSGRARRERTVLAAAGLIIFFRGSLYHRAEAFVQMYREALSMPADAALEDFEKNSAAFYALLEKLTGAQPRQQMIYSSIPAQLAAQIEAHPLDLSCFKGNLRAYQGFGARYILDQKKVLLGDEMGLGKTIQAIAAMAHLYADNPGSRFLIVCPASVLINWCREIVKFSDVPPYLVHGARRKETFAAWKEKGGAAVTNYENMDWVAKEINNCMHLDLLVIDEAHYIKNPKALRTKRIRTLEDESERIVLMTGTPLENRVDEMCELIGFVKPDLVGEIRKYAGLRQAPAFREMLASAYLRRRREDVLEELPPLTIENEWCAMTEQDREAYAAAALDRNFVSMRRVSFLQEDLSTSSKALRLAELCEQACSEGRRVVVFSYFRETVRKVVEMLGGEKTSPAMNAEDTESDQSASAADSMMRAEENSFAGDSAELAEKDSSAAGSAEQAEKSAFASGSTEQTEKDASAAGSAEQAEKDASADGSSEQAEKNSRKYAHMLVGEITGSTPVEERQALIDRFSDSPGGGVLVCQIQAGGTGLNIQAASVVIFCEPQIKPSLTRQALSRVYRMGQVRTVLVFHLLCEDTVDEAVMQILDTKQMEFDLFAEESVLADAADDLADREWIRSVIEEERSKYLPAIRPE